MRLPWVVLGCAILVTGCSEAKPRAPYQASDCVDHCAYGVPTGSVNPGGDAGRTPSIVDGGGTSSLTGQVAIFKDALFENTEAFAAVGIIKVRGAHLVTGALTGTNFLVDHTDFGKTLWVGLHATSTSGGVSLLDTIMPVDGTGPDVEVAFGKTSVMTEIAALVSPIPPALTAPSLDPNAAHVVVRFVDGSGSRVPGVRLALQTGVLYDSGVASYSDTSGVTAGRGVAIVVNATTPGVPLPGAQVSFQYQTLASTSALKFDAYVAPGALTVMTVLVPP